MLHKRERGSREARLATVRLGLFTITTLIVLILLALTAVIWLGFSAANDAEGVDYSMGDYIGDVGGVIIPSIIIIVVAALALNFGYTFWLNNQEEGSGGGE
jgi:heme/copper-type cytochrome/quinol oxidase subunit 2